MASILLVEPPRVYKNANIRILGSLGQYKGDFCWAPLDLTIIAGFLRKHGYESQILDANARKLDFKDVKDYITKNQPETIFFLTSTSTAVNDMNVARIAKEVSKDIKTIVMGTHVSIKPEKILAQNEDLDIVIWDPEPEMSVLSLIQNDLNPKKSPGVCYWDGITIKKNPYEKLMNLDELGIPAHDKLDLSIYTDPLMVRKPFTLTYTSRGCRWSKCIYCSCPYFYEPLRFRSISLVIEELKWLNELGIKEVKWFDAELNHDIEYTTELCDRIISEGIDLTWSADMRVDNLPVELLQKMRDAGCHTILIGVESGDSEIRKKIPKGITGKQVQEAVKNIKATGMNVITHFVLGLPNETRKTMQKTLDFAKELDPDATTFGILVPHPGTEFHRYIEENGYFNTTDYNKFDTSNPPVYDYPQLSSEEIYDFMKHAYRSFYFRPRYILKKISKVRNFNEIENGFKNFRNLVERFVLAR